MTSIKVKPFLFFVWVACLLFIFIVFLVIAMSKQALLPTVS